MDHGLLHMNTEALRGLPVQDSSLVVAMLIWRSVTVFFLGATAKVRARVAAGRLGIAVGPFFPKLWGGARQSLCMVSSDLSQNYCRGLNEHQGCGLRFLRLSKYVVPRKYVKTKKGFL